MLASCGPSLTPRESRSSSLCRKRYVTVGRRENGREKREEGERGEGGKGRRESGREGREDRARKRREEERKRFGICKKNSPSKYTQVCKIA